MKSIHLRFCAILFVAFVNISFADSTIDTIVVSANRSDTPLAELSASVSQVTTREIQRVNAVHINQTLSRIPGTWITRGNGQEHLSAIRSPVFTGAGACGAFLMTQDGIPLRASGFCNINQLFDSHSEAASLIEVGRGPNSVLYGSNALFGSINVVLPEPLDNTDNAGRLSLTFSEHQYRRLHLDHSGVVKDQPLRIFLTLDSDGGFRDDSGYDEQKLSFKHQWRDGDLTVTNGFTVTNLRQDTAGFIEGVDAYKDSNVRLTNASPEAYRDKTTFLFYSRWQWQLDQDSMLSITPYWRNNEMEFLMHFLPWQPLETNEHQSIGGQLQWQKQFADQFELLLGADIEFTKAALLEEQFQTAPFAPQRFPQGIHYDYDVDAQSIAGFAKLNWSVTPKLMLETALRYDSNGYDYTNNTDDGSACAAGIANCRFFRPADRSNDFEFASSKLALIYTAAENLMGYITISRAFRAPQATELYRLQQGQAIADLNEVELLNSEIGFRGEQGSLFYQLSFFDTDKRDGIFQDTQRQFVSGAQTRHTGIEYDLSWRIGAELTVRLTGSYAKHQYQNDPNLLGVSTQLKNNDIDTAPRNINNLVLEWVPRSDAEVELEWHQMGDYFTDPENLNSYPGHRLLNLRAAYRITPGMRLTAVVTNLSDELYAERADFAFGDARYFPGEGAKLSLGLDWRF